MQQSRKQRKRTFSKSFHRAVYVVLGTAVVIFSLYNVLQLSSLATAFDQRLAEAIETARPAEIQLATISTPSCEDCYDIEAVAGVIESTGVNITSREELVFSSEGAKSLIEQYSIDKVPTVIVKGEINKSKSLSYRLSQMGEERGDAYVFTQLEPPFIEPSTGKVRGRVSLTHLVKYNCQNCTELTTFIAQLASSGLKLANQQEIPIDSDAGRSLVDKYGVEKLPSIIMDKEAEVYSNVVQAWNKLGTVESDGSFVLRTATPPYYSVAEETVKGLVSLTVLADESCANCYEPDQFHKPVLRSIGVFFADERRLDISSPEAKQLISQYEIDRVPTILLQGDVEEYPVLVQAWQTVGTAEPDGMYVFRRVEVARQPYRNLTSNEVVGPAAST